LSEFIALFFVTRAALRFLDTSSFAPSMILRGSTMGTEVLQLDHEDRTDDLVSAATHTLDEGGLVVFPTETVYGVAARVDRPKAMARLRRVKSREDDTPFTVHIGTREASNRYVADLDGIADRFARKGWPGPLTLLLQTRIQEAGVSRELDPSTARSLAPEGIIGLRCPDHPFASAMLRIVQAPVVASSANYVGQPPPRSGSAVAADFLQEAGLLIDAGATRYTKSSTIVRVQGNDYEIVRTGVFDERIIRKMATLTILFVCTGNTCRSPMAAAIARKMLAARLGCRVGELRKRGIVVESAGTFGGASGAADHAIKAMRRRGADISRHRSRALTPEHVHQADYVFAMTEAHVDAVIRTAPSSRDRVFLLLGDQDLPDPFGGSEEQYEHCAQTIEQALEKRIREVKL
jgi:tRNA threonylcarbamoyl adenosine modification protein (Sua5/YciO/YrdC/YwlC family)